MKQRETERLNRKYRLEEKGTLYVSVMLKQKIKAGGIKIKRYDERHQQFKQINSFELTRNPSMKLWMERKKRGRTT